MNNSLKILALTVSVSLGALASPSFAGSSAQDSAFDKNSQPVYDSWGKCVRTRWDGRNDPCAPAPIPEPTPAPAPAPEPVKAPEPQVQLEQRTIYFDFNSDALDAEAIEKLTKLTEIINSSQEIADAKIIGYTDQYGKHDYNVALASRRAKAVESYLDKNSRLDVTVAETRGVGKAPAEAECATIKAKPEQKACMRKERRVEVEFKYLQQ